METKTRFGFKSMPTYYKGITFRSRLEARWAIIFDELGIAWEYEPEALSLDFCGSTIDYLPDFYLPKVDCFVEIKGNLTDTEFVRLMRISACVTAPHGGRPFEFGGKPFVTLGNLGSGDFYPTPNALSSHKGLIVMTPSPAWFTCQDCSLGMSDPAQSWWDETDDLSETPGESTYGKDITWMSDFICNGDPGVSSFHRKDPWAQAMKVARNARFDRGHHV
jgi:hypothetical protein